jgi:hypothetical protein
MGMINCNYCGKSVLFKYWGSFKHPLCQIQQRGGVKSCGGYDECLDCFIKRDNKNKQSKILRKIYPKYERLLYHKVKLLNGLKIKE